MAVSWKRAVLFVPPVVAGALVLVWQAKTRAAPEQAPPQERTAAVRVVEVAPLDVVPRAVGFGPVAPGRTWQAVAEVSGRVVYRHPELDRGALLKAGTELLRIDPAPYELAVARAEADVRAVEAQVAELALSRENTAELLAIEEAALQSQEKELERKRELVRRGATTKSALDQEERAVLGQRKKVQDLRNALRLLPVQERVLREQQAVNEARLAEARLDLDRTHLVLPFEARIASVSVEETQFVQAGQSLAAADGVAVSEVEAQIPLDRFRYVMGAAATDASIMSATRLSDLGEALGMSAEVSLSSGSFTAMWDAKVARISDTIDPKTRTVGVIVAVEAPYAKVVPGVRPPLAKGMFVEVEVRGPVLTGRIVLPRGAVHDGVVHVVGEGDRLERRPVSVAMAQGDFVVVASGLMAGERVVVSDLMPAIDGMKLVAQRDTDLEMRLAMQAKAETSR